MSPTAQRLSTAFIRLSAEEPFNLYCEKFLREGFESWPDRYRRRFDGLEGWGGIEQLRRGTRRLAGASEQASVLLASRSLSLIKAAAKTLFGSSRKLLTTDLSWPSYQDVLVAEATRRGRQVISVPVRDDILTGRLTTDALAERLAAVFVRKKCDSLFLPAVDNLGVLVPVPEIVKRIEDRSPIRFVLTDAAQALAQVPLAAVCRSSDFLVAGCHKWVRGYYPLGIGIGGDRSRIPACREPSVQAYQLNAEVIASDPLAGFLENLETGRFAQHSETVNLGPLFSCQGALHDRMELDFATDGECQLRAAAQVRELTAKVGFRAIDREAETRTGIELVDCRVGTSSDLLAAAIEQKLMRCGIVATAYDNGLIRISLPGRPLNDIEAGRLERGFKAVRNAQKAQKTRISNAS